MLKPGLLYFAYGCNMDLAFLEGVIGTELPPAWPARLIGWRLAFNKGREGEGEGGDGVVANLVEDEDCLAYGVVYRLPREALEALDAFEKAPEHYRRETVWVEPLGRRASQAALTYIAQPEWTVPAGRPARAYLDVLLRGAALHGLPEPYIDWVRALAEGSISEVYQPDSGRG
jgi:cation transport regulator ChaC